MTTKCPHGARTTMNLTDVLDDAKVDDLIQTALTYLPSSDILTLVSLAKSWRAARRRVVELQPAGGPPSNGGGDTVS